MGGESGKARGGRGWEVGGKRWEMERMGMGGGEEETEGEWVVKGKWEKGAG